MTKVTIGTRGSKLARIQAAMAGEALQQSFPELLVETVEIKTTGDKITDIPLEKIGDKGVFIKELEAALHNGEIDLAVHSMKDMPATLTPGLTIGAIMRREEPRDAFIANVPVSGLSDLKPGSRIGSSSLRRKAQLLHHYPHLEICPVRGNIDTRIKKLQRGDFDGMVLACAGLNRLGCADMITARIPVDLCLPAVGQGAIGLEIKEGDNETSTMVAALNCSQTAVAVHAERAFLRRLEGGCQLPVGALAEKKGTKLHLTGMVASLDGKALFTGEKEGDPGEAELLGTALAEELLKEGCGEVLAQIRREGGFGDGVN